MVGALWTPPGGLVRREEEALVKGGLAAPLESTDSTLLSPSIQERPRASRPVNSAAS